MRLRRVASRTPSRTVIAPGGTSDVGGEPVQNVVWIALAAAISVNAIRLGLWTPSGPGSGFMPLVAGLTIGLMALLRVLVTPRRPRSPFWVDASGGKRVMLCVLALCAMAAVMPFLGFFVAAVLVMGFLMRLTSTSRIPTIVVLALFSSLVVYGLFHSLLGVQLPRGFVGF
jgi:putative tricarboxylic transport membrane protein